MVSSSLSPNHSIPPDSQLWAGSPPASLPRGVPGLWAFTHTSWSNSNFLVPDANWLISSSLQSLSHVELFVTPWTTPHQASLSITDSWNLLKLMLIEPVMPSNHLILCHPLHSPSVFLSIRVFSNESALCIRWPKY